MLKPNVRARVTKRNLWVDFEKPARAPGLDIASQMST
jgi:hypothetical protein